jgi:RND family efflux transporter MFP subunit
MNNYNMRRVVFLLVSLSPCLLVCLASGCGQASGKPRRGAVKERLPRLEVIRPVRKRLVRRLELAATVEALKKVDLAARVPGVVGFLDDKMDIGRAVKKDEVLLRLSVPDLEADKQHKEALVVEARKREKLAEETVTVARREVEEAEKEDKRYMADQEYHKVRLARIRELVKARAQDPQVELEAVKLSESADAALAANRARAAKLAARVQAALADLDLARQRIKVAEADVKKVAEQITFATVRAPFDGVITRRWVDPGATIKDPGAILLTIMQVDRVRVLIDVPQRDVPYINSREQNPNPDGRGDPVDLRLPVLNQSTKNGHGEFRGFITRISRSLDPVTRTMRAEIEMDNPSGQLDPGMYGTALVLVEDRSNVLTVPAAALVRRGEGMVEVFHVVVDEAGGQGDERRGVLRRIPVVLGIDDGKEVEIRDGLKGDELIVARGNGSMRADDRVNAVSERDPAALTR